MANPKDEPRLTLHAPMTNAYWAMITMAVNGVLALIYGIVDLCREGNWRSTDAAFMACVALVLIGIIAYCERKARWIIARPSGLEIIERKRSRTVPWRDVLRIEDLGWMGGGPTAKRHYLELADGSAFTFLADPDAIKELPKIRGN